MSQQEWSPLYDGSIDGDELRRRFREGGYPVAVYGLGKMGLPIAATFASITGRVTGVDLDRERVRRINEGACPVDGEPGLPDLLATVVGDGALDATTDGRAAAAEARVHVVIVPTLVHDNGVPDLSAVQSVLGDVAEGLQPGDLVLVESTVPPRTCVDVIEPALADSSGLSVDAFGVAFCPERTKSGQALADVRGTHPKVVGGTDPAATRVAAALYRTVTENEVVPVADATTAECVKVFEGVYRDVNIALANELATFADELDVDVIEAIEAANALPVCDIHTPGIGVGGHCIPYYPYFLLTPFESDAPLVRTARAVNDGMPAFAVRKLARGLAADGVPLHDARVLVLGLTYRPGVAETRKSPAMPVARLLANAGATVYGVDPVLEDASAFPLESVPLDRLPELDLDAAVLVTAHEAFQAIDWDALDPMVVVDGRDALTDVASDHRRYTIGRGPAGNDGLWDYFRRD